MLVLVLSATVLVIDYEQEQRCAEHDNEVPCPRFSPWVTKDRQVYAVFRSRECTATVIQKLAISARARETLKTKKRRRSGEAKKRGHGTF